MQIIDTTERALVLLDRAAIMRLDPDPLIGIVTDARTDEPILGGALGLNIGVYERILVDIELAHATLNLFGWGERCRRRSAPCVIPHHSFARFQAIVHRASRRSQSAWADACALDNLLDGEAFNTVHRTLAQFVQRGANARCSSIVHPKR